MNNELQSTKTGVRTGYQNIDGHISQIPGLSPTISSGSEKSRGRRVGVLESDSEYVKLAKQGGHKGYNEVYNSHPLQLRGSISGVGLLWHNESMVPTPNSNNPTEPCPVSEDISPPSVITSEETKNPGAFQPLEPPFGTDNMSAWERDHNSNDGKEKNNNNDTDGQMENVQTSEETQKINKFKRISFDKRPASVNMSKLLSFGYAGNNIQQK